MNKDAVLSIRLTPRLKRDFRQLAIDMECTYFELLSILVGMMKAKRHRHARAEQEQIAEMFQEEGAVDAHSRMLKDLEERFESVRELDRQLGRMRK